MGPQGAAETFTGSWSSLGGSLGVSRAFRGVLVGSGESLGISRILRGVLGSSGGSLGVIWDLRGVLGGLGRVPGGQLGPSQGPGVLGRAPGRPWGEAGPFKGCWGPTETTIATSRWPFIPPQLVRDPRTSLRSLSHPHSKKVSSQVTLCLGLCPAPLVLSLPLLRSHPGGTPYSQIFSKLNRSGSQSPSKRLPAMEHLSGPLLESLTVTPSLLYW